VGFEGYINAKVLVEALRRAGRALTRERFLRAVESMTDFAIGPDVRLSFGPADHQGLDTVYFTVLRGGRFVLLDRWNDIQGARQ
jgi:hypothetical protein